MEEPLVRSSTMKLNVAILIAIRIFLGMAIALPTLQIDPRHIPYGVDEFRPFLVRNSTDVLPLSKNLTQVIKRIELESNCSLANLVLLTRFNDFDGLINVCSSGTSAHWQNTVVV